MSCLYSMTWGAPYLTPRTRDASDYPTSQDLDAPGWRDKNWDFSEWFFNKWDRMLGAIGCLKIAVAVDPGRVDPELNYGHVLVEESRDSRGTSRITPYACSHGLDILSWDPKCVHVSWDRGNNIRPDPVTYEMLSGTSYDSTREHYA